MPLSALHAFFFSFYENYDARVPFEGALSTCPKCRLGYCLGKHGFEREAYPVYIPIIRSKDSLERLVLVQSKLTNISLKDIVRTFEDRRGCRRSPRTH
jgi:hypothetical protein